jgi:hypothetical protein
MTKKTAGCFRENRVSIEKCNQRVVSNISLKNPPSPIPLLLQKACRRRGDEFSNAYLTEKHAKERKKHSLMHP